MDQERFSLPDNFKDCVTNVWMEYSDLARKYKPLNLGQGAPDFGAPKVLSDALKKVANDDNPLVHQYTRGFGHVRLVNVLSKLYSPLINREIDPLMEIITTNGATEALYCSIVGIVKPGDEVIIMEPYFDCYEYLIRIAGGVPRYIPLIPKPNATSSGDWVFDETKLKELFNPRTKMIILNTPHNPTGKVFTLKELETIANLCKRFDVLCISDEVYEWMIYKPFQHIRIATLPDMWERTITIGSAGKTFSATGWKIGWAYGPSNLIENLRVLHQNYVYTCCTPLQEGLALAFEEEIELLGTEKSYFVGLMESLEKKRNFCAQFLANCGMKPINPEGGYFMMANWSPLENTVDLKEEKDTYKDFKFTKWMSKNIGLQVIPSSAFYSTPNKFLGENFLRFCFIKKDENLQKAAEILTKQWPNN